jgi:hypothetical protein
MRLDKSLFQALDDQATNTVRTSIDLVIRSRALIASTRTSIELTRQRLAESARRISASKPVAPQHHD